MKRRTSGARSEKRHRGRKKPNGPGERLARVPPSGPCASPRRTACCHPTLPPATAKSHRRASAGAGSPLHTKQRDHDTPLHVCTHPAIKLRSAHTWSRPTPPPPRCGQHVRQTPYSSQPTPHLNPRQRNGGRWQRCKTDEAVRWLAPQPKQTKYSLRSELLVSEMEDRKSVV